MMKSITYILKTPIIPKLSLSNFALCLFLFNCIFDPGNALFHTKQITFFFALVTNIKKMSCKNLFPIFNFLIFYVVFFVSASLMMLRKIDYESSFLNMYSTTFLLLKKLKYLIDKANELGIEITTRSKIWKYYEL